MGMTAQNLRNSILQYAIEGRLASQNPTDTPASVLLQEIVSERNKLERQKQIKKVPHATIYKGADGCYYEKKEDGTSKCIEDDIPFEIPQSWEWVRLIDICSVLNGDRGKNYPSKSKLSSSGIPFISALNLDGKSVVSDDKLLCVSEEQYNKLGNGKLRKDDIVVCIRGSLGKHGKYPYERGAIASSLVILRPYLNNVLSSYIMFYLDTPLFFQEIRKYDNGTAQPNLAAKNLEQFFVPIPPLEEQRRIVMELERLEPFFAEYECLEKELSNLDANIHDKLWKSILQYAIEGKLVLQNSNEASASEVINKVFVIKHKLEGEGVCKKNKNESVIYKGDDGHFYEKAGNSEKDITDKIPFDVPNSWCWSRLQDICIVTAGGTPARENPKYWNGGKIPWLKISDITSSNKYVNSATEYITQEGLQNSSAKIMVEGTILYTIFATIGEVGILNFPACCNQAIAGVSVILPEMRDYVYYYLKNLQNFMRSKSKGCAQFNINQMLLKTALIPIPPLGEQKRIVEEIEKYESLLGRLGELV